MAENDEVWCLYVKKHKYNIKKEEKICYVLNIVANYRSSRLLMPRGSRVLRTFMD